MFSHVTVGYNDRAATEIFYRTVMPTLGLSLQQENEHYLMFARNADAPPWIFVVPPYDRQPATGGNGFHVALIAESSDAVDLFHQLAISSGGLDDGAPGLRPHYSSDYYGAYVRDPAGNKIQAVCYLKGRTAHRIGKTISHITIGANDLDRAAAFYESLFETLGYVRLPDEEHPGEDFVFGIAATSLPVTLVQRPFDGKKACRGNGQHAAFLAKTRDAVDRFHETALRLGGTDEGLPGLRANYHPSYYAAYIRDLDGNKIQAVCHKPPE